MRKLLPAILSLLLLAACTNSALRTQNSALAKADSLCSVQPDSALALLSQLESEMQQADKATRMYYQLLCIKASDKAYITHTSDSLIQEVLQYYIRKNDRHHLPEAYYYAGRVCRDLGDAPQALDYFQKAIDILPTEDEYELKSRIYSQMGTLFYYQQMYDEALKCIRKCYDLDVLIS
ncbi:MAG: tetratricopeptide repeat protein, partial [Bacteroides sp.]|nr:tetratricopeptide repeat protein [Bacteroides sp.]